MKRREQPLARTTPDRLKDIRKRVLPRNPGTRGTIHGTLERVHTATCRTWKTLQKCDGYTFMNKNKYKVLVYPYRKRTHVCIGAYTFDYTSLCVGLPSSRVAVGRPTFCAHVHDGQFGPNERLRSARHPSAYVGHHSIPGCTHICLYCVSTNTTGGVSAGDTVTVE